MANQSRQFVLQVESAQEVGLLAGKELNQEIYIAVFTPVTEYGAKDPKCFHRGTADGKPRSSRTSQGLEVVTPGCIDFDACYSQGLNSFTPVPGKSATFRVTRVIP